MESLGSFVQNILNEVIQQAITNDTYMEDIQELTVQQEIVNNTADVGDVKEQSDDNNPEVTSTQVKKRPSDANNNNDKHLQKVNSVADDWEKGLIADFDPNLKLTGTHKLLLVEQFDTDIYSTQAGFVTERPIF